MKNMLLATLFATPLFWGCQKEPAPSKPVKPVIESAKTIHCSPWRDVYGYSDLCSELNGFALCSTSACSGGSLTLSSSNTSLQDPNGDAYVISVDEQVIPSRQSEIMSQASGWATANTPSGYFVSAISYSPTSPGVTSGANLTIQVTYRKCTGGGGGAS